MASDAMGTPPSHSGPAAGAFAPGLDDDIDPMSSALGYEAADPLLLAQLWGEPVTASAPGGDLR